MSGIKIKLLRMALSALPVRKAIKAEFFLKARYVPNLNTPETFNEKIQSRKLRWQNPLFVECSDKLNVRGYVTEYLGEEYLIPLLYSGESLSKEKVNDLIEQHGRIVLKVSNDQGSVVLLDKNTSQPERVNAVEFIHDRATKAHSYGSVRHESWYSENPTRMLVEKDIRVDENVLEDYKIHTFFADGEFQQVLAIDFSRGTSDRSRTFYDADLNIIRISQAAFANKQLACPVETGIAKQLFAAAKTLGRNFSYSRVDLYVVGSKIYFGELTFAPGSGFTRFSSYQDDMYLGRLWKGDPAL